MPLILFVEFSRFVKSNNFYYKHTRSNGTVFEIGSFSSRANLCKDNII